MIVDVDTKYFVKVIYKKVNHLFDTEPCSNYSHILIVYDRLSSELPSDSYDIYLFSCEKSTALIGTNGSIKEA